MFQRAICMIVGSVIASTLYTHQWIGLTLALVIGAWLVVDDDVVGRLDPDRPSR